MENSNAVRSLVYNSSVFIGFATYQVLDAQLMIGPDYVRRIPLSFRSVDLGRFSRQLMWLVNKYERLSHLRIASLSLAIILVLYTL